MLSPGHQKYSRMRHFSVVVRGGNRSTSADVSSFGAKSTPPKQMRPFSSSMLSLRSRRGSGWFARSSLQHASQRSISIAGEADSLLQIFRQNRLNSPRVVGLPCASSNSLSKSSSVMMYPMLGFDLTQLAGSFQSSFASMQKIHGANSSSTT